eukprot:176385_1
MRDKAHIIKSKQKTNPDDIPIGTSCQVYSRSYKQWYYGEITDIIIDAKTKARWFFVSYKNGAQNKKIQRNSKNLKILNSSQSKAIKQQDVEEKKKREAMQKKRKERETQKNEERIKSSKRSI